MKFFYLFLFQKYKRKTFYFSVSSLILCQVNAIVLFKKRPA
jgi:hypothetical protein